MAVGGPVRPRGLLVIVGLHGPAVLPVHLAVDLLTTLGSQRHHVALPERMQESQAPDGGTAIDDCGSLRWVARSVPPVRFAGGWQLEWCSPGSWVALRARRWRHRRPRADRLRSERERCKEMPCLQDSPPDHPQANRGRSTGAVAS